MPGGDAATAFLKQSLIVVKPYAGAFHQFGGNFPEPFAQYKGFNRIIFEPKIKQLQKGFPVSASFFKRTGLLVHQVNPCSYYFIEIVNYFRR